MPKVPAAASAALQDESRNDDMGREFDDWTQDGDVGRPCIALTQVHPEVRQATSIQFGGRMNVSTGAITALQCANRFPARPPHECEEARVEVRDSKPRLKASRVSTLLAGIWRATVTFNSWLAYAS